MPVLRLEELQAVRNYLDAEVNRNVTIKMYTASSGGIIIPGRECTGCRPVQDLLAEVSGLSPKVTLETIDYHANLADAQKDGVARIPAFTVGRNNASRMRYFGTPSDRLLGVLVSALIGASTNKSPLKLDTRRRLRRLKEDAHIQVFVARDGQYCSETASLAYAMARESPKVTTDVIEVGSFPDLPSLYSIRGVPKTMINGRVQFTGAMTEEVFLKQVLRATGEVEAGGEQIVDYSDQMTPLAR
jgi:alkyl hydroperoxide reductase subunit AhpF